ncbi:MAG: HAMP domain-containing histidine kinase [Actinobacteria bacterium]|nr:HAMP domain-containing histidine kinase [Actinomycetota bacterium]
MSPPDFTAVATSVAHELATPLSVVSLSLQLLRSELAARDADAEEIELVDAALRNLQLVELQAGRLRDLDPDREPRLQVQQTDVTELIRLLVADLDRTLLIEHVTRTVVPDELVAEVDPARIRQLLYTLLSNAAKYCPAGRAVVVTARQDGPDLVLAVRDEGHSVAPEGAERLFERYERRRDDVPGAGLGLYLARRYAQGHGGELRLLPADDDVGNTFEARLPSPNVGARSA